MVNKRFMVQSLAGCQPQSLHAERASIFLLCASFQSPASVVLLNMRRSPAEYPKLFLAELRLHVSNTL